MKLKFNLFVGLGVIVSVATPGAYAWGAAGSSGFVPFAYNGVTPIRRA